MVKQCGDYLLGVKAQTRKDTFTPPSAVYCLYYSLSLLLTFGTIFFCSHNGSSFLVMALLLLWLWLLWWVEKFAGQVINWAPIVRQWKGLLEDISARTILANRKAVSGPGDEKVLLYDTNCSVCQHRLLASDYPTALCLSLFHHPGQTVDQCTVHLSGTNCATTHSQGHTANFGFPSVGEIHFKHWQHLSWECNLKISLKKQNTHKKNPILTSCHGMWFGRFTLRSL